MFGKCHALKIGRPISEFLNAKYLSSFPLNLIGRGPCLTNQVLTIGSAFAARIGFISPIVKILGGIRGLHRGVRVIWIWSFFVIDSFNFTHNHVIVRIVERVFHESRMIKIENIRKYYKILLPSTKLTFLLPSGHAGNHLPFFSIFYNCTMVFCLKRRINDSNIACWFV